MFCLNSSKALVNIHLKSSSSPRARQEQHTTTTQTNLRSPYIPRAEIDYSERGFYSSPSLQADTIKVETVAEPASILKGLVDCSPTNDENVRKQLKAPSGLVTYVEPIANYQSYGVPQSYELGYNYNHINPKTVTSQTTQTRTSSSTTRQYSPPTGSNRSGAQTTYQPLNSGAQPKTDRHIRQ